MVCVFATESESPFTLQVVSSERAYRMRSANSSNIVTQISSELLILVRRMTYFLGGAKILLHLCTKIIILVKVTFIIYLELGSKPGSPSKPSDKGVRRIAILRIFCIILLRVLVTRDGVRIGNWIY
jgi:hypothetical protein